MNVLQIMERLLTISSNFEEFQLRVILPDLKTFVLLVPNERDTGA